MLLLAFETSAKAASVALFDGNILLGEQYQNTGLTHSQTLLVMAENLLSQCGKKPSQVEAVAVASGPGSFTGVRIGVAAAKGFAWGGELPIYGVSTLEAMALGLGAWEGVICPVMDARRSQVYNALFYVNQGEVTRQCEDRAISLEDLEKELKNLSKPVFLVGDGSNLCYNTLLESIPNLVMPPEHRLHQRAVGVGLAALMRMAAGDAGDGGSLTPNYLRLSQAERERMERQAASS
ncbi:MAG: tRNA (adenosine(37)-N6)-threonylcarbamoyltransferase complex dimerization subunit type 1 TsaB [Oscillospiraceae bacterium]|nr:tRNA (adenosine(37)-N6)-threonylcarbamoyltransferase complex dimerization subunit type 1 TsaB [Oscillospiraceae bacterium]